MEIDEEIVVARCLDPELNMLELLGVGMLMSRTEKKWYKLASVCLHRGDKADFGHYVAAYREEGVKEWVLCNDSKVVLAADAPISECYLAFYEKKY